MHVNIKSIYLIKANNVYNLTKHKLEPDSENKKDQKEFLHVQYIFYFKRFRFKDMRIKYTTICFNLI